MGTVCFRSGVRIRPVRDLGLDLIQRRCVELGLLEGLWLEVVLVVALQGDAAEDYDHNAQHYVQRALNSLSIHHVAHLTQGFDHVG